MHYYLARMGLVAMFEQVNTLPGSKQKPSIGHRNTNRHLRQG